MGPGYFILPPPLPPPVGPRNGQCHEKACKLKKWIANSLFPSRYTYKLRVTYCWRAHKICQLIKTFHRYIKSLVKHLLNGHFKQIFLYIVNILRDSLHLVKFKNRKNPLKLKEFLTVRTILNRLKTR